MSSLNVRPRFLGTEPSIGQPVKPAKATVPASNLELAKCRYIFSTTVQGNLSFKWGSSADVIANRQAVLSKLNLDLSQCVTLAGAKKAKPMIVTAEHAGAGMFKAQDALATEALITNQTKLGLMVLTADCLPLIVYHPHIPALAAVHVSRQVLDTQLVSETIKLLCQTYDLNPAELQAVIGPGIHANSYRLETPPVLTQPWWAECVAPAGRHHVTVDLPKAARLVLTKSGIPLTQIWTHPSDTAQDEQYFSHYRATKTGESEGRFATVVVLDPYRPALS